MGKFFIALGIDFANNNSNTKNPTKMFMPKIIRTKEIYTGSGDIFILFVHMKAEYIYIYSYSLVVY